MTQKIVTSATVEHPAGEKLSLQGSTLADAIENAVAEAVKLGGEEQRVVSVTVERESGVEVWGGGGVELYSVELRTRLL